MKISEMGKESILIVTEIIARRIQWIKENEPHATKEIEENEIALDLIRNLMDLDISM